MAQPVILVTGASSGIGKATAQHLATRGFTVYAAARPRTRYAMPASARVVLLLRQLLSDRQFDALSRRQLSTASGPTATDRQAAHR